MKRLAPIAGLFCFALFSHQAFAGDAFISVFLDDAPLQGARVTLDDVPVGSTNAQGIAETDISAGDHVLTLSDDDIEFPIAFSSAPDQDVEIRVTFTSVPPAESLSTPTWDSHVAYP